MNIFNLIVLQYLSVYCVEILTSNTSNTEELFSSLFTKGEIPNNGDIPLLNRKVFRGTRVTIREHPYVVSIRRMFSHYLTGTLLTKNVIITVAHPIYQVPTTELRVIAGENYCDRGTALLTVLLTIIHEDFSPYTLNADLALIRLYEDLMLKTSIKTLSIVLPNQSIDGCMAFVTGWGRCDRTGKELCLPRSSYYYNGEIMDPMLRTIKFTIKMPNKYCEPYHRDINMKEGMLCLGESRAEDILCSCMAVPGAPLVVDNQLVALQSWGYGCGYTNDMPVVYTNMQVYQPWLLHNLQVLRNLSKQDLTNVFKATKAQFLYQWLIKTRISVPVLKFPTRDEILSLDIDVKLSQLNGSVCDVRDYMFSRRYHESKKILYDTTREEMKTIHRYVDKKKLRSKPFLDKRVLNDMGLNNQFTTKNNPESTSIN